MMNVSCCFCSSAVSAALLARARVPPHSVQYQYYRAVHQFRSRKNYSLITTAHGRLLADSSSHASPSTLNDRPGLAPIHRNRSFTDCIDPHANENVDVMRTIALRNGRCPRGNRRYSRCFIQRRVPHRNGTAKHVQCFKLKTS